jgi:DNA-binding CsgD family transcriptional regulator
MSVVEHLASTTDDEDWLRVVTTETQAIFSQSGIGGTLFRNQFGHPIAGVYSGFLAPEFSQSILTDETPWVNGRAARSIAAGKPAILPTPERNLNAYLAAAQVGLHMHMFLFDWLGGHAAEVTYKLRAALAQDLVNRYCGAPIRYITVEARAVYREEAERTGFRVFRTYPGEETCLMLADIQAFEDHMIPTLMALLKRDRPRLKLSPTYRRLLYFHQRGYTDEEIADALGLSRSSMKTYWDRIFTVFCEVIDFGPNGSKRRAVSAYLQLHPEECWPC